MSAQFTVTLDGHETVVTIHPSGGRDGAIVVQVDTDYAPDASDGGPGLRVLVNDGDGFVGVPWVNPNEVQYGDRGECTKCRTEVEFVGTEQSEKEAELGIDTGHGWWDRGGNYSCPDGGTHESNGSGR